MLINSQVSSLTNSATLKITALTKQIKKQGKDVVNFAAGEPDFDTPDFVKAAAHEAIEKGFTKYTPSTGDVELKEAIAARLKDSNNIIVDKENIVVTAGAKYAVFVALLALTTPESEVLIPSPYWVSYPEMVKLTPARTKYIDLPKTNGFKLTPEILERSITEKTKVLILNYPSNPTGSTYSYKELNALAEVIRKNNIYVVSDEIYEALVYDQKEHVSFASLGSVQDQTITVSGFSKSFSMTGWRVGYLAANSNLVSEIGKVLAHTTSCPCSISQAAALAAFQDREWQVEAKVKFQERRDLLYQGLLQVPKIEPRKSEGTFYMFCDISSTGLSSLDFCTRLLNEKLVSCIPSSPFGIEGFIRISFSTGIDQINKGIDRIRSFIQELC